MNDQPPIATIAVAVIAVIVVLAGALVTIINPDALSFNQYLTALSQAAIGAGALGIGRGILGASKAANATPAFSNLGDEAEFPGGSIPPAIPAAGQPS